MKSTPGTSGTHEPRAAGHEPRAVRAHPNYVGIWLWLLALTLAEVAVIYLHLPRLVLISSLLTMALVKASLVAMYYMHLKFERILLTFIFTSPLILSVVLTVLVLFDTPPFH